jgi:glycerophosphoryl diester phosphodiesterase
MSSEPIRAIAVAAFASVLAIVVSGGGCAGRPEVVHRRFPNGGLVATGTPLGAAESRWLRGMFTSEGLGVAFGEEVGVYGTQNYVSILGRRNASYALLRAACIDGGARVVFEGEWRRATDVTTGLVRLFLEPDAAAEALCRNEIPAEGVRDGITLRGAIAEGDDMPSAPLAFRFARALKEPRGQFVVASHRGACRTIDDCGASENSLASLRLAEAFGANVAEVDVRRTADGVPVLFHDANFNPRLTRGQYCHGPVESFTLAHVRALCQLAYGEDVPTLEEALTTAIDETELEGLWLDIKSADVLPDVLALVERYSAYARTRGRTIELVVGLPTEDVLHAYERLTSGPPGEGGPPSAVPPRSCLVELETSDVRRAGCRVWAPRYTIGPVPDEVRAMQAEGRAVAFWTIDEESFIDLFLTRARPNAILTNRPALVFHRFQSIGTIPESEFTR